MKIAFVSYEHPAGIDGGGIGTYIGQIAKILHDKGHDVEVFSGSKTTEYTLTKYQGYLLHRIPTTNRDKFRYAVLPYFIDRHSTTHFDILESPEYGADGLEIKKSYPNLPLIVKLHTPSYLVKELNSSTKGFFNKARFILGGIRRGKLIKPLTYNKFIDPEYEITLLADTVLSPSKSLAALVKKKWRLKKEVQVLPYPFVPSTELLNIDLSDSGEDIVTFIGKLEERKGILPLMEAIPKVLNKFPNTTFAFVGKSLASPKIGYSMEEYIKDNLQKYSANLKFYGFQPYNKIVNRLSESTICIFPSLWENFPNVCLEAMAAGRTVIGTNNGGMADMITHKESGYLIKPNSANSIAKAITYLLTNKNLLSHFRLNARATILKGYNADIIEKLTVEICQQTINNVEIN